MDNVRTLPTKPRQQRRSTDEAVPAKVWQFVPKARGPVVVHDVVRDLELLLRYARLGQVKGLAWAITRPDGAFNCDLSGAARDVDVAIELCGQVVSKARRLAMAGRSDA